MADSTPAAPAGGGPPLAGRIVLVTGASTGIGRAIALACARAGADVAVTFRSEVRPATEVSREIERLGRCSAVFPLDLTDDGAVSRLATDLIAQFGRVDVWINNAGADILTGDAASRSPREKLDLILAVDLRGTVFASWEAVRLMRDQPTGGVILNMSWDHVLTGMRGTNPEIYSAAKGGILSFSKSLARSVAPKIRVNVLAPGWIETEFATSVMDRAHYDEVARGTPLARWGTPEDVARAAVFLASDDASFLTGQTLMIGGGIVM